MPSAIKKKLAPAPKGHWLFGSAYYFAKDAIPFIMENCPKNGGIFRVTSRVVNVMIVNHPDYIKHILQDNNRNYVKSFGYDKMKALLGNGLLTSEGEFWKKQRRLIQPAFHRERMASLTAIMTKSVEDELERMEQMDKSQPVNIAKQMMSVALNIVARSLFSSDVKDLVETVGREMDIANEAVIERIRNPFKLPIWVPTSSNAHEKKALSELNRVIASIIESRRKSGETHHDLMGMLMDTQDEETGEKMDDRQLMDEALTIFLAGHETTALALTWLWYCLDQNPEVEEKVFQEASTVLNGRTPKFEDMKDLPYIRMVIDETLRLYPPAWMIGRRTLEDDEIGGYHIPKDMDLLIPAYYIHRDPQLWDEPEKFIPERFGKEKAKTYHRFAYFPFGGGQRMCVGNNFALVEMQLVVAMLAQKFRFRLKEGFVPELDPLITLRAKHGMMMRVEKRLGFEK